MTSSSCDAGGSTRPVVGDCHDSAWVSSTGDWTYTDTHDRPTARLHVRHVNRCVSPFHCLLNQLPERDPLHNLALFFAREISAIASFLQALTAKDGHWQGERRARGNGSGERALALEVINRTVREFAGLENRQSIQRQA
jgi:hypothetical protein